MRQDPSSPILIVALLAASSLLAGCVDDQAPEPRLVAAGTVPSGAVLWSFGDDAYSSGRHGGRTLQSGFDVDTATVDRFLVHLSGTLVEDHATVEALLTPPEGADQETVSLHAEEGGQDDYGTIRTFFAFDRVVRAEGAGDGDDDNATQRWNVTLKGEEAVGTVKLVVRAFSPDGAVTDRTFSLDADNMTTGRLRITVAADGAGSPPAATLFGPRVEPLAELALGGPQGSAQTIVVADDPGDHTLRIDHGAFAGNVTWRVDALGSA